LVDSKNEKLKGNHLAAKMKTDRDCRDEDVLTECRCNNRSERDYKKLYLEIM